VSLGLLKLGPGAQPDTVLAQLRQLLSEDVQVLPRAEVLQRERRFWVRTTSVGIMFGAGVGVALLAGMVFFYQVISSDFRKHAAEFATLKALGYRKRFLSGVVLQQAFLLAALGFTVGLPLSLVLYELTRRIALLPMTMELPRVVLVLFLTASMCGVSGLLCVRRVHTADPASLY
jgi:putative ABC transport system permease protein